MKIGGFQKATLIDYPGKVACIVFLYGCNFRCGFCYNTDLVLGDGREGFSEEEILDFLEKRKGKLDGVCITGGEPLMSLDFDFVRKIKDLGYLIKIDTNGSFPEKLRELIDLGFVDFISMDLKGSKEKYSEVAGVSVNLEKIEESIKIVGNFPESEFRTTVVYRFHDANEIKKIGEWVSGVCGKKPSNYFLQGFRPEGEMVDSDFLNEKRVSESFLLNLREVALDYFEEVGVR